MKHNVIVRALSGIVYVGLIVGCILAGKIWFCLLLTVLSIGAVIEYLNLAGKTAGGRLPKFHYILTVITAFFIWLFSLILTEDEITIFYSIPIFIIYLPLLFCSGVFLKSPLALTGVKNSLFSFFYIVFPLCFLYFIYSIYGIESILFIFIGIWINDTGAFCVGCSIGRHRLCERLSPKKSWEGFWGGLFFTVVAALIYAIITHRDIPFMCIYGAAISVLATIGDLFESLLKRKAGVKDSGNLIPGHGGVLDRIDSLLFVSWVAFFLGAAIFVRAI